MSTRTAQEQDAADGFHYEKCRTTKWWSCGVVLGFIGIVMLISAIAVYYAWELHQWAGAQWSDNCFIYNLQQGNRCSSNTCTDEAVCTQTVYVVRPTDDATCAIAECLKWDNGCTSVTIDGPCDQTNEQPQFSTGDITKCYVYSEGDRICQESAGRLDPDNEWQDQYTTFVVLLVLAIIFVIIAIILCVVGGIRCLCKRVEDDVLGESKGTGCYWCMDYERCCYGEGVGHATVVNPQDKNLPIKDHRQRDQQTDGRNKKQGKYDKQRSDDYEIDEDDEQVELR
mmetsp:Transcript_31565/g.51099  ORF Transcript_31565/g.51099 Transcript_31565/m.51099 type:complete len:283 (-) Transcript_31565:116-964(-)